MTWALMAQETRGPFLSESRIYYLAPDSNVPSWGTGLLYGHVRLLRKLGFEAYALHHQAPFRMTWLSESVPTRYLDSPDFQPNRGDLLVVPEVSVRDALALSFPGTKGVFVQGSFLILKDFARAIDYSDLGFSFCLAVLPHVKEIVDQHYGLEAHIVPPYVAPYFLATDSELDTPRKRTIVLYANRSYTEAGYPDFGIVRAILERAVTDELRDWELRTLEGLSHEATAELLKESAILVNVNVLEAFNTTVPEAMAAGCIAVCYDAYGGRDFLVNNQNSFCFPNNHVYPLVNKVLRLARDWTDQDKELADIRRRARDTVESYNESATRAALGETFSALVDAAHGTSTTGC